MTEDERYLTFVEHLEELRWRIIRVIVFLIIASIIGYIFTDPIIRAIARPIGGKLYFFTPTEAFFAKIKIAFYIGGFATIPFFIYQAAAFVFPALTHKERKYTAPFVIFSTILFFIGFLFAYFVVLPLGLKFLLSFGGEAMTPLININRYLSFLFWFTIAIGILFELPLLAFFLTRMGVISPELLSQRRREAIVVLLFIVAIITPTVDFATLLIVSLPLIILYEVGILLSRLAVRLR
ncbi:twin-arginine translocase subunit TatC [candidate division WOR-3 bacterium]|uniref:Sec-independent protein translocase protein TatC n=1 Tax=candidate division WOR-3 bacterium TaxID=2052148 RepID=A0A660SHU4_UNCW3|nr:MAG: twin-arginine translocase subunit TatC [candidate division WOR-3 bacterium]